MPLMFVLYLFQYLDKTSLGYTAIMGILQDAVNQPVIYINKKHER
jgi:hypothetical protein